MLATESCIPAVVVVSGSVSAAVLRRSRGDSLEIGKSSGAARITQASQGQNSCNGEYIGIIERSYQRAARLHERSFDPGSSGLALASLPPAS